jgi:K(+)-stimulated pyrophosphate-energized sodium pump
LSDFLTDHGVIVALICALAAVAYGAVTSRSLLALSPGNETMRSLSHAIQEGASAYLNRQYRTIAIVGAVLFVALIFIQELEVAIGFLVGGVLSGAAGYIGMNVSVRSNARVAEAARGGIPPALQAAFRGGAITGMLVVGLALLGVAGYYGLLVGRLRPGREGRGRRPHRPRLRRLAHLRLRPSGRRHLHEGRRRRRRPRRQGGGRHPRGRPRNPAVIADNVGDNVGDCAGMAADLFETYAVTAVAVMLLGVLTFEDQAAVAIYPLVLGGVAIIASIIGTYAVRTTTGNVERALYQGLVVSAVIAAVLFLPVTLWLMDDLTFARGGQPGPSAFDLYLCALVGLVVTALLFLITDYYTSTRFAPVRKTAEASQTGHATNIISGLAQGLQATALPALVLVLGILVAWNLAGGGDEGIYGIAVAVMGQLSLTGLIVALDAFGPITDNAAASPRWPTSRTRCATSPTRSTRSATRRRPSPRATRSAPPSSPPSCSSRRSSSSSRTRA